MTAHARRQYADIAAQVESVARQTADIPDALAAYLADTDTPQGIFCICPIPSSEHVPDVERCYAALERIQDPGNLGTMIRTAEAFGLGGVMLTDGCCDPYSPKVLRSSMGGVFRLPIIAVGTLAERLPQLHAEGFRSYACVVERDAAAVQKTVFPRGSICVIGNEGSGLLPETATACSERITIPMAGRAESLNASMAAGIVFWEMVREHE